MKIIGLFISVLILISACEKFGESDNESKNSRFSSNNSHENGVNCMNCHYSEGKGEGWFTLAGTINGSYQHSTIELYEHKDSLSIQNIEVDQRGNFYTTKPIDYKNGLFVGVRSSTGLIVFKESKIFFGQCNLCHGAKERKLEVVW